MKIRKQVNDLKPADFLAFPIWEFASDEEGDEGQDETTVRPYARGRAADPRDGMLVVKARFKCADGKELSGYVSPPTPDDPGPGAIQPVVTTEFGQVGFWCGTIEPTKEQLDRSYGLLSSSPDCLFPLAYESAAPVLGGPIQGTIEGFMILEDWRTGQFRVER